MRYLPRVGVVDLDDGAGGAQAGVVGDLLHGEDRAAGDVVLVQLGHGLELGLGHCPVLDAVKDGLQLGEAGGLGLA